MTWTRTSNRAKTTPLKLNTSSNLRVSDTNWLTNLEVYSWKLFEYFYMVLLPQKYQSWNQRWQRDKKRTINSLMKRSKHFLYYLSISMFVKYSSSSGKALTNGVGKLSWITEVPKKFTSLRSWSFSSSTQSGSGWCE